MDGGPHLIFGLAGMRYAVPAVDVTEVVWLPELSPVAEAPPWVAGVVSFRGRIIPVLDLALRLGRPAEERRLSDAVVVLARGGRELGVIVSDVYDVIALAPEQAAAAPAAARAAGLASRFVGGVIELQGEIVMLLELDALLNLADVLGAMPSLPEGELSALPAPAAPAALVPFDETARAILRERAQSLRLAQEEKDHAGYLSLAVVELGAEYFGVDLGAVREFVPAGQPTRVPCSPPHIAGVINLRGDVLTLVDVRGKLQLPPAEAGAAGHVMVVEAERLRVGVLVDRVLDVLSVPPGAVEPMPYGARVAADGYFSGTTGYAGKMLTLLHLSRLLHSTDLVVNDDL